MRLRLKVSDGQSSGVSKVSLSMDDNCSLQQLRKVVVESLGVGSDSHVHVSLNSKVCTVKIF